LALNKNPTMNTTIRTIPLIILLLSLTFSCKKDPASPSKDITGQWKWIFTQAVYPSDPLTPDNTGLQEILVFNSNHDWFKTKNGIKVDSGTYSLGHGSNTPYEGARIYIYDSVLYYRFSNKSNAWDYYNVFHDTLQFCPGFADKFASYNSFNLKDGFNGSKFWKKQ
jgi:hypothetical protein